MDNLERRPPADLRLSIYKGVKQFLLFAGVGLLIKLTVLDSLVVKGMQMAPQVRAGDRILTFGTPYLPGISNLFVRPRRGKPVVFKTPIEGKTALLRTAAVSGDTVSVSNGLFFLGNRPMVDPSSAQNDNVLPADYSPRDFMAPYRVPAPGDSLNLTKLPLRDFFFTFSVLKQENPGTAYQLQTSLIVDDTLSNSYFIKDFSLYKGRLDSIPEQFRRDWFFWDRLQEYLRMTMNDANPDLQFRVLDQDGQEVNGFRVKNRYIFLLGDNWQRSLDSRYFGPVRTNAVKGRALMTLWGFGADSNGKRKLNFSRFGRIIH